MYIGTFKNVREIPFQGFTLLEIENEFGDDWYSFRDSKTRMKYIIATDSSGFVVYSGASGQIGFPTPLKIFTTNEKPPKGRWNYDGEKFTEYFNFDEWKYNELLKIRDAIEDAEDSGLDTTELKKYRKQIKSCTDKANVQSPINNIL